MRIVECRQITDSLKEMCIEATHFLSEDMREALNRAIQEEKSPLGKKVLDSLEENLSIAGNDMIPICQDTGMAVVFMEIGQDVHIVGGNLEEAVNEGCLLYTSAVDPHREIMLITTGGIIIRMPVDGISMLGRITSGVKLIDMDIEKDIKVASIAKVREDEEIEETEEVDETDHEEDNE